MQSAPDEEVLELARRNRRTLISADTDFGMLLARTGAPGPSVVLIRRSRARRANELAALLSDEDEDVSPPPRRSGPALDAPPEGSPLALLSEDGVLVAIGERRGNRIQPRKVFT